MKELPHGIYCLSRKEENASDPMGLRSQGMMTPEPYGHLRTILSSEEAS
jgi:hypothetical protein